MKRSSDTSLGMSSESAAMLDQDSNVHTEILYTIDQEVGSRVTLESAKSDTGTLIYSNYPTKI